MRKSFSVVITFIFVIFTFFVVTTPSKAEIAEHLVISEIQIAGATASEDFVEIYNPTSSAISLEGYRLVKRTSTGTADTSIVAFTSSDEVPAYGYFLWCNTGITSSLGCDKNTSATVAFNNSVALRNGPIDTGEVTDAVTFGVVTNPLGEGTPIAASPNSSGSAERKANSSSTSGSMGIGGTDEFFGNSEDTNDNSQDFVMRNASQAQNKLSSAEIQPTPTPTQTPTPTETPTVEPTPSVTPTPEPTPIESPTPEASPTPSPTPEESPTPEPTATPSPTTTPSATPEPTPTTSPTPSPDTFPPGWFTSPILTCTNQSVPEFVYIRLKLLMPWKFHCTDF